MNAQAAIPGGKPLVSSILVELHDHLPVLCRLCDADAGQWRPWSDDPASKSLEALAAVGAITLNTFAVGERSVHRPVFTPIGSELAWNLLHRMHNRWAQFI